MASIVHLATILPPHASRSTPQQRGQVVRRPSPAGYCLPPTAKLEKTERGPISTSGPLCQYVTKPGDRAGKIQSVSPRSPPPNRRPPSRGRRCSTPAATGLPAGWLQAAKLILSLLSLSARIRPSGPAWCPRDSLSPPRDGQTARARSERHELHVLSPPAACMERSQLLSYILFRSTPTVETTTHG